MECKVNVDAKKLASILGGLSVFCKSTIRFFEDSTLQYLAYEDDKIEKLLQTSGNEL